MTNDYKNDILDYITNNVTQTTGSNVPLFTDSTTLNTSLTERIKTKLGVASFVFSDYLYDEQTQIIAIYGRVNNDYGFIYLVDKDLNEIKMITQFSSGLNLFPLYDLKKDETGNIYGITQNIDGADYIKRVILLNNIFAKLPNGDYQVKLRQSYITPHNELYVARNTTLWKQTTKKIIKVPGEATYFIFLLAPSKFYILRFTINVGSTNDWVLTDTNLNIYGQDALIEKNNDTPTLYLFSSSLASGKEKHLYTYTLTNDVFTETEDLTTDIEIEFVFAKSTDLLYIGGSDSGMHNSYLKKVLNGTLSTIETFNTNTYLNIQLINEIIVLHKWNSSTGCIGILQGDTPYYSTSVSVPTSSVTFFVLLSYNLLVFYLSTGTNLSPTTTKYTLDYNPLNYNGLTYDDYNQTAMSKGRLYSNGEMVFARNLYNLTLNGATSTGTIQVPNTLLNGITISQEDLIGATNTILSTQSESIQKNIYETLYVNFIQTLSVLDEDENINYPLTASYINQNINVGTQQNCEDTSVGKVVINYSNGQFTQSVLWTYNVDHYELSFIIDARSDSVTSFDLISNDESTIYITKEVNLQSGNYYQVDLKLRIE